jgi:hypothetical protein
MKYGLNRMNTKLFTQQVGWCGGNWVEFHPWGPRIKLHKWHLLLSMMKYWLNILYLLRLLKLNVYLSKLNLGRLNGLLSHLN